jgi:hypothetical protein
MRGGEGSRLGPSGVVARFLAFAITVAAASVAFDPSVAQAADPQQAREKMVELNKQALLYYDLKDWATAKDLLSRALERATEAGLEGNNMTARTYVHLGCVQWTGFQDKAAAMRSFSMAKKIRPDIQLTPLLETAELKAMFDLAGDEAEVPEAAPATPATPPPRPTNADVATRSVARGTSGDEPALPENMSSPLMCAVPAVVRPKRELQIRCALEPGLNPSLVQIHYRAPGEETYRALGMQRSPGGWYVVTLPSSAMKPGMLQVYFDARDGSGNELASNGQVDSPSVIAVRRGGLRRGGSRDDDPMAHVNDLIRAEQYEAGLRRRRAGALWLGAGAGVGWGYVPGGTLEWQKEVRVSSLTTTTGQFHLLPEIGYMISDNFAVALQGRLEFIRQEQAVYTDPRTNEQQSLTANLTGAPTTMAAAGFARAIGYTDISDSGNVRLSFSLDVGGGFVRFPVKPVAAMVYDSEKDEYVPDYSSTIAKTDTRPVGMFLGGASVGLLWNLSRRFAISLDGRALTGFPNWGAVVEGGLSLHLAFGGVRGPEASQEEEDEEGEEGIDDVTDRWWEEE